MADLNTEWFMEPSVRANYRTMVYYPGAGQDTFDINFEGGYINRSDVKAFMVKDDTRDRVNLAVTFVGGSTSRVKVSQVVPKGWTVCIFRDTPKAKPLAQFTDGAIINEKNLDRNAQQAMFAVSEMVDRFDSTVDSVESALKEVYEANQKSEQAIKTANEAKVIAQGAVQTANTAVTKADQAISTANTASSKADGAIKTANDAKSIAQGLDAQIKAANATSAKAVETANQANATANNALKVANGIDAKATQALNNSTTAINTANGVDAKATQAQKDAKEALEKANTAINTGNVAKGLTDRVASLPNQNDIVWKGKHTFNPGIVASGVTADTYTMLYTSGDNGTILEHNRGGRTVSLVMTLNGLYFKGQDVMTVGHTSPYIYNSFDINSSVNNARISLKNTGNNVYYNITNAGSTLYFSRIDSGSETGYAMLPNPNKAENIAYHSYVNSFVSRRDTYNYLHSSPGSHVEYRLDETANTAELWMRGRLVQKTIGNDISIYSNTQYASLRAYRGDNTHIIVTTEPYEGRPNFGNIINRGSSGSNLSVLGLPNKSGTLAITSEHYTKQETDNLLNTVGSHTANFQKQRHGNSVGDYGTGVWHSQEHVITFPAVSKPSCVIIDMYYDCRARAHLTPASNYPFTVTGGTVTTFRDESAPTSSNNTKVGYVKRMIEIPANSTCIVKYKAVMQSTSNGNSFDAFFTVRGNRSTTSDNFVII